jgi:RNA polymerase sigma-70 factor (ECF subfamily)
MPEPMPEDSQETELLLEQIVRGEAMFERLFARHRAALRQVVQWRLDPTLRTRVDASDVVQETQMEAFRRLPDYLRRRPMPFYLWLRKTAHERLLMLRRKHVGVLRRSVRRELPLPDESSLLLARQFTSPTPTPSQQLSQRELAAQVRRAVGQLGEADREILLMRHFEGLSYQEIACVLKIEPAAARQRNGRALLRLHKLLSQDGLTESVL